MSLLGAWVLVLGFMVLLIALRLEAGLQAMREASTGALATMKDKSLSDAQKEKRVQAATIQMGRAAITTILKLVIAFAIPLGLVWGLEQASLWTVDEVIDRSLGWDVLVGATVVGLVLAKVLAGRGSGQEKAVANDA
ncbi:MAG: hypothetical protein AAF196_00700 [Planctomycetota bacterium]